MNKINLTPHTLNLYDEDGIPVATIPPSGDVARVAVRRVANGNIDGIPVFKTTYGQVAGLPAPRPGTIYIVSGMVRAHPDVRDRADVFQPGELLRDTDGRPVGAIGLSQ